MQEEFFQIRSDLLTALLHESFIDTNYESISRN